MASSSLTRTTTTGALASAAVAQSLAALRAPTREGARANAYGASVNACAFLHYRWMAQTRDDAERVRLRYGDWAVTTPLLLLELQALCEIEDQAWAVGAVVVMVALGYASRVASSAAARWAAFGASSVLLAAVAVATVRGARAHRDFVTWFFGLWALYPLAFLLPDSASNPAFDALDLCSKAAYGFAVAHAGG